MKALPVALAGVLLAGAANASVYIGVSSGDGPITQVASDANNAVWSGFVGNPFEISNIAVNNVTDHLNEVSLNVRSTEAGVFHVWASSTDQVGLTGLLSSFTMNAIRSGWTVTMESFLDLANGIFTTPLLIGSALFNAIGADVDPAPGAASEPYSVTSDITITTPRGAPGTANGTIQISSVPSQVPEPSSLMLLGTGLVWLGRFYRPGRRRTT